MTGRTDFMVSGQICYNCDFMSVTGEGLKACPMHCGLAASETVQVWEGMDDTDHYDIYSSETVYGPGDCYLLKDCERVGKREDILKDIISFKRTLTELMYFDWEFDFVDLVKLGLELGYFSYYWEL